MSLIWHDVAWLRAILNNSNYGYLYFGLVDMATEGSHIFIMGQWLKSIFFIDNKVM